MRTLRLLFVAALMVLALPAQAHADPISTAILAAVSITATTVGATAFAIIQGVLTFALSTLASIGLSYIAKAISGKPDSAAQQLGIKGTIQLGGDLPRSFLVGYSATAGSLVYVNTWGQDGKTPNAYLTMVISLSDLPITALRQIWVNDVLVTWPGGGTATSYGTPISEFSKDGKDYLWAKFCDGTQTAADPWLTSQFGGDLNYPYSSGRIGKGVAYVIMTARLNSDLFSGFPRFKFAGDGAKFYDPRKDSTAGGSGTHRFDDPSTWEFTLNPKVIEYNVLRGISFDGKWLYGLQSMTPSRLPTDSWFAAMNECDLLVDNSAGDQEPQYRCGAEVPVNMTPADLIDAFDMACNGRIAEIGGIYKAYAGAAGAAVFAFTDDDLLITEAKSFDMFPSLGELVNGCSATYPEPEEGWAAKDAPAYIDPTLEEEDGGRELLASVQYTLVPYAEQVQRLMRSAVKEGRKFRKHTAVAPPAFWMLEPGDIVAWTSATNGYDAKSFRVDTGTDQDNLDVGLVLVEVDPGDYDWNPATDYKPVSNGPLLLVPPPAQAIAGWQVSAVAIPGDNGRSRAAIRLQWDADVDDVNGVFYQVRLASTAAIVLSGVTDYWNVGLLDISESILPSTDYEARGRYRPRSPRETTSSDWLPVTTANVTGLIGSDITGLIPATNALPGRGPALPATGTLGDIFVLDTDGELYRYGASGWTRALDGTSLTDSSVDLTKLAAGINPPLKVAALPVPNDSGTDIVLLSTDNKLYRWNGTAWTNAIDGADISSYSVLPSKVYIGDTTNMVADPLFRDPGYWAVNGIYTFIDTTAAQLAALGVDAAGKIVAQGTFAEPNRGIAPNISFPAEPGKSWRLGCKYLVTAGFNGAVFCYVAWRDKDGNVVSFSNVATAAANYQASPPAADTIGTITGIVTAPPDVVFGTFSLGLDWINNANSNGTAFYVNPQCNRAADSDLIIDGGVHARNMGADSVEAGAIAAQAVGTRELKFGAATGSKLYLGDTSNMLLNTDFSDLDYWGIFNPGVTYTTTHWALGTMHATKGVYCDGNGYPVNGSASGSQVVGHNGSLFIPVEPGRNYRVALDIVALAGATCVPEVWLVWYDKDKAAITNSFCAVGSQDFRSVPAPANLTLHVDQIVAAPATAAFVSFRCAAFWSNAITNGGAVVLANPRLMRASGAELIVDGSVIAQKMSVVSLQSITADMGTLTLGVLRSADGKTVVDLTNSSVIFKTGSFGGTLDAGTVNANNVNANNVVITDHIQNNNVTNTAIFVSAPKTIGTVETTLLNGSYTAKGDTKVLIQITDNFTRQGGHSPVVTYTIKRIDGATVNIMGTVKAGGSGVTVYQPIALTIVDTESVAHAVTYTVTAVSDDATCTSNSLLMTVTELKR